MFAMRLLINVTLALLLTTNDGWADGDVSPEYRVKAGFLFNFIAFARWPTPAGGAMQLCIHGDNPFGASVEALENKPVHGTRLEVMQTTTVAQLNDCEVIFVSTAGDRDMQAISAAVAGRPVLTIADQNGALDKGMGINMITRQDRIAFEIDLLIVEANGIRLSSKLLSLATEVRR